MGHSGGKPRSLLSMMFSLYLFLRSTKDIRLNTIFAQGRESIDQRPYRCADCILTHHRNSKYRCERALFNVNLE
jgi:hypothetical protein